MPAITTLPWGTEIPANVSDIRKAQLILAEVAPGRGVELYEKLVARIGEEPVVLLGIGHMGVAFGLPSGRVLKFTKDLHELEAASFLSRHHPHRNVARFYDVVLAQGSSGAVGVVMRDGVNEIVEDIGELAGLAETLRGITGDAARLFRVTLGPEYRGDRRAAMRGAMEFFLEMFADVEFDDPQERAVADDVLAGMRFLYDEGVYGVDFHGKNIGFIDDRAVIFDIGFTEAPAVAVETLQGLRGLPRLVA